MTTQTQAGGDATMDTAASSPWVEEVVPGPVRLAAGRTGQGGTPVVALHGITSHHHAFNAIARRLAYPDGMLALDLRGRGDSDKPESGYGRRHAHDVARVLDHYGIEQAVLAGHSMGAFVAIQTALLYPGRVRGLMLLDGGWPRLETPADADAEAVRAGLARAFSRLSMTFASPDDYLSFWFPGQNLTMDALPPDLADNYRYDLARDAEGRWRPKALLAAALEDAEFMAQESPTAAELRAVRCPVALIRAEQGFFPGTAGLITPAALAAMREALDVRSDLLLEGATHYTMMYEPVAAAAADNIDAFLAALSS